MDGEDRGAAGCPILARSGSTDESGEGSAPESPDRARAGWNLKPHAVAGMEAPLLFAIMVLVEGFLVPGYSQVAQPMSDLGAYSLYGAYAVLQNLNFWAFGVLVLTFSVGLGVALPRSGATTNSLVMFSILVVVAGLFPDQPNPYPGAVHAAVSIAAFCFVILSQFLLWRRLRGSTGEEKTVWGRYAAYSLASGILSIILLVAFGSSQGSPFYGAVQRVFVAVPWLWIGVLAVALYRSR